MQSLVIGHYGQRVIFRAVDPLAVAVDCRVDDDGRRRSFDLGRPGRFLAHRNGLDADLRTVNGIRFGVGRLLSLGLWRLVRFVLHLLEVRDAVTESQVVVLEGVSFLVEFLRSGGQFMELRPERLLLALPDDHQVDGSRLEQFNDVSFVPFGHQTTVNLQQPAVVD